MHLSLEPAPQDCQGAQIALEGIDATVRFPAGFNFREPQRQSWARNIVAGVLRRRAQEYFEERLDLFCQQFGRQYNRVIVKNVSTRWGSCSSLHNINLSLWLLCLPPVLIDYVIKHEMAHLRVLSHNRLFWAELDKLTGGPGTAALLDAQLRQAERALIDENNRRLQAAQI